ncbi:MAG: membrane protein insertase YidC [Clostridia bacterium]|nr:membrane protein insertase YidC [Clostridia bacterium]MBP5766106.1 membrane protein insertase YidC [Clostridia bacterium]
MNYISTYLAFGNYGLAIIYFTIFVKILLLPLTLKQQLSTLRTQALQPELDALKKACGNDNQLYMQEQQKIYTKYNVNPMSGCLPTLIMFPVIIVVYNIIRAPLTYIAGLGTEAVNKLAAIMQPAPIEQIKNVDQLKVNSYFLNNPSAVTEEVTSIMNGSSFVNMKFLKIFDLGAVPFSCFTEKSWALAPLLLIPLVTLATQYLLQWVSSPNRNKKDKSADPTGRSMRMFMLFMPLLTFGIAMSAPAGLGFYWAVSNLLSLLQTILINKFFLKKKEV